jgi:hypothetical protein
VSDSTKEIASQYNEDVNDNNTGRVYFLDEYMNLKDVGCFQVRNLQKMIKLALGKVEVLNVNMKNELSNFEFDTNHITKFRQQCKNTKLRSIFHRLLNKDFFHAIKLHMYKITDSTKCQRCPLTEDNAHLLYHCEYSRKMWDSFNEFMKNLQPTSVLVHKFEDIFDFSGNALNNILKVKLVQETIQINRPKIWNVEKIKNLYEEQERLYSHNKTNLTS